MAKSVSSSPSAPTRSPTPTARPSSNAPTKSPTPTARPSAGDGFSKSKPATPSVTPPRAGVTRSVAPEQTGATASKAVATPRDRGATLAAKPGTETLAADATKAKTGTAQDPKFLEATKALDEAKGPDARRKAANGVAEWTRDNMVNPEQLKGYLAREDVSAADKQATLGKLALEINRSEMVLGRAHAGGDGTFEHKGKNQGDFVDTYQKSAPNAKDDAWCTKFATSPYQKLGMDLDKTTGGSKYPLLSGSRLTALTTKGKDGSKQAIPANTTLADPGTTGTVTTGKTFSELTSALNKAKPEDRAQVTADFMTKHGTPQPGDIIIRDPNNAVKGNSHTLMVDRYDPKTNKLHTIEGNAGDRVQGFSYDLSDPTVAAQMGHLARFGPEQFNAAAPPNGGPPVSGEQLLNNARQINKALIELAGNKGWVHSTDVNATSAMLSSGGDNAWTPKSKTTTR